MATDTSSRKLLWLINRDNPGLKLTPNDIVFALPEDKTINDKVKTTVKLSANPTANTYTGSAVVTYDRLIPGDEVVTKDRSRPDDRNGTDKDSLVVAVRAELCEQYSISTGNSNDFAFVSVDYTNPKQTRITFNNDKCFLLKGTTVAIVNHAYDLSKHDGKLLGNEIDPVNFTA